MKIPLQFCLLKLTKLYLAFKTLYKIKSQWNAVFKILVFQIINHFIYSNEVGSLDNISELVLLYAVSFLLQLVSVITVIVICYGPRDIL